MRDLERAHNDEIEALGQSQRQARPELLQMRAYVADMEADLGVCRGGLSSQRQSRPKVAANSPNMLPCPAPSSISPVSAERFPSLIDVGPTSAEFAATQSVVGPKTADFGRVHPQFGRSWANSNLRRGIFAPLRLFS